MNSNTKTKDLPAGRGGDERGRGDTGRGDRRHRERAGDFRRERFVKEAEHDPGVGVEMRGEGGVEVREVVAGREDHGRSGFHAGLFEDFRAADVAANHGDAEVVKFVEERVGRVGIGFGMDDDDRFVESRRPLMTCRPTLQAPTTTTCLR